MISYMNQTQQQYEAVIARCKSLFLKKAQDYGTSWRILRMPSITDQIYIKAERIRSIQESGENKVGDSIEGEFMGIINYCAIALILWKFQGKDEQEIEAKVSNLADLETLYDEQVTMSYEVMEKKNHDYGEAWRKVRISSITDLILMKIFRLKKIEDNKGELLVSEGVDANYVDMLNYAVFSLIKMNV